MNNYYSDNKNQQLLIALLKAHGIKRVIASPGGTNTSLVASFQYDKHFEMYSCIDERSAAYMACGMAEQSGEPVVICCTGATASRNYMPALTEAFYRKLPVIAITCSRPSYNIGHLCPQVTDRTYYAKDVFVNGEQLQVVKDEADIADCEFKINKNLLACKRHGGGPIHFNVEVVTQACSTKNLPQVNVINRITISSVFPELPKGKIAIFIGSHKRFSKELQDSLDAFCHNHDAVIFYDHTSGYHGNYGILYSLIGCQEKHRYINICELDLLIHIGEVSGEYYSINNLSGKQVWRVNEDGEIRIRFKHLEYIFEMTEKLFFDYYKEASATNNDFYTQCRSIYNSIYAKLPNSLPLCHISIAKFLANTIPSNSVVHLSILNALRSWNFFETSPEMRFNSNVGGFGIDGCTSSLIGASLMDKDRLFFLITGDLAFFYDLNALGNRHIDKNIRILLMNDGRGTEFRHWQWAEYKVNFDEYVAAAGHFGNRSKKLLPGFAEALGFKYLSANSFDTFADIIHLFINPSSDKPIILECFSKSEDQSDAWYKISHIVNNTMGDALNKGAKTIMELLKY